jgi:hypothetical protein
MIWLSVNFDFLIALSFKAEEVSIFELSTVQGSLRRHADVELLFEQLHHSSARPKRKSQLELLRALFTDQALNVSLLLGCELWLFGQADSPKVWGPKPGCQRLRRPP